MSTCQEVVAGLIAALKLIENGGYPPEIKYQFNDVLMRRIAREALAVAARSPEPRHAQQPMKDTFKQSTSILPLRTRIQEAAPPHRVCGYCGDAIIAGQPTVADDFGSPGERMHLGCAADRDDGDALDRDLGDS